MPSLEAAPQPPALPTKAPQPFRGATTPPPLGSR